MAISLLHNIDEDECYRNIFSENFDKNHCSNCQNGIHSFLRMPGLKKFLQKFYVGPMCYTKLIDTAAEEKLIKNDADPGNDSQSTGNEFLSKEDQEKADQVKISAIKEVLRGSLLSIASKLLASEHDRFHHLSKAEQQLWNSFKKADIYEFLTGEKDCIPEFQFNWVSPEAPAIRCIVPPGALPRVQQAAPLPAAQQAPPVPPAPPAAPAQAVLPENFHSNSKQLIQHHRIKRLSISRSTSQKYLRYPLHKFLRNKRSLVQIVSYEIKHQLITRNCIPE